MEFYEELEDDFDVEDYQDDPYMQLIFEEFEKITEEEQKEGRVFVWNMPKMTQIQMFSATMLRLLQQVDPDTTCRMDIKTPMIDFVGVIFRCDLVSFDMHTFCKSVKGYELVDTIDIDVTNDDKLEISFGFRNCCVAADREG